MAPKKQKQDFLSATERQQSGDIAARYKNAYRNSVGQRAALHTRKAHQWYMKRISKDVKQANSLRKKVVGEEKYRRRGRGEIRIGDLYLFQYPDPVHKDTLPYYDTWPCVFFFDEYTSKAGKRIVLGLNFHYLPPALRYKLFDDLLKLRNEKRYRPTTRLKMSWKTIKAASKTNAYAAAVHAYRVDRIRGGLIKVNPTDWAQVIALPIANWKKSSRQNVYADTKSKLRK